MIVTTTLTVYLIAVAIGLLSPVKQNPDVVRNYDNMS